ncbi:MAG: helix-turn-helix transcriptional regulator [Lachnospiraceae bacterium]|nr:helix-turn-helix transcriptional regulator [Lachnospiraceae bacterium]
MTFADKLKMLRAGAKMSQSELASAIGVTARAVQKWEGEGTYPRKRDTYAALAALFGCDLDYLLTEKEDFVMRAGEAYGSAGRRDASQLVTEVTGLFAGGEMAEEDMDVMMEAIQRAYFDAKSRNREKAAGRTGRSKAVNAGESFVNASETIKGADAAEAVTGSKAGNVTGKGARG